MTGSQRRASITDSAWPQRAQAGIVADRVADGSLTHECDGRGTEYNCSIGSNSYVSASDASPSTHRRSHDASRSSVEQTQPTSLDAELARLRRAVYGFGERYAPEIVEQQYEVVRAPSANAPPTSRSDSTRSRNDKPKSTLRPAEDNQQSSRSSGQYRAPRKEHLPESAESNINGKPPAKGFPIPPPAARFTPPQRSFADPFSPRKTLPSVPVYDGYPSDPSSRSFLTASHYKVVWPARAVTPQHNEHQPTHRDSTLDTGTVRITTPRDYDVEIITPGGYDVEITRPGRNEARRHRSKRASRFGR